MGIFWAIFALSFLIFFHELGHFLVARFFGVHVETFSIGFGPKLLRFSHKNTEYAISAIPLGGYVKLKGEIKPQDENTILKIFRKPCNDSLNSKHPIKRILILFAGPLFNFIVAFLIYLSLFYVYGISTFSTQPIIGEINSKSPALNILMPNDKIVSIEDKPVKEFQDIAKILNSLPNIAITKNAMPPQDIIPLPYHASILVERNTNTHCKDINCSHTTLESHNTTHTNDVASHALDSTNLYALNVPLALYHNKVVLGVLPLQEKQNLSIFQSFQEAYRATKDGIILIYDGLKKLVIGAIGLDNISGVIGITDMSAKAYQTSLVNFLLIVAIISINLGILNLLPLPLLDGGQILFTCYEWIMKKPINQHFANVLVWVGLSFIVGLMLLGIFNDIRRLQ